MQGDSCNSRFAYLFVWMTKAKFTMGIFYTVFVLFYLLLGLAGPQANVTLDLPTAIEMVFACFAIGLAQQAMMPGGNLTRPRCLLWLVLGTLVTLGFSLVFRWFEGFAPWCLGVYVATIALGMGAMLLSSYLALQHETHRLNRKLEQFQQQLANDPLKKREG